MIPLPLGKLAEVGAKITRIIGDNINSLLHRKEGLLAKQVDLKEIDAEVNRAIQDGLLEMAKLQQAEYEAQLKDIQDARSTYAKIQESEKASWLSKNIMPMLTIGVTVGFFGLLGYMLKYSVPQSNERIMDILLGSLGTAWITMVSFYFGSSKGSEDKQKQLNSIQNSK